LVDGVEGTLVHARRWLAAVAAIFAFSTLWLASVACAQVDPFAPGWDLDRSQSNIKFQSIKYTAEHKMKVESSSFATFDASIEPTGDATIKVALDSVDTLVDLRNVRMRFLFFETFKYPEATVRVHLTPEMIADLPAKRRETLTVLFTFDLHGVEAQLEAPVTVTLLSDDQISVASAVPISIAAADFGLAENITKLENAVGGITVVPSATVTFDLLFQRRGTATVPPAGEPAQPEQVQSVALESSGNFSSEECVGRFKTLSRTGNIYFRTASARLQEDSYPLLGSVVDIVRRCPQLKVVISGYTDSDGSPDTNRVLSEARARSVMEYLVGKGIGQQQLTVVGYGEEHPVAPNDTAHNKSLNRRIEFSAQHAS
jgi:outer membrane protein OmpA-like peptidoglycan-associated protein